MKPLPAIFILLGFLAGRASAESATQPVALDDQAETAAFNVPAKPRFKLFLLIGQSNMAGRGAITVRDRQANPRVFKLDATNSWVPATDPLHFDKPAVNGVGPGKTFGEQVAAAYPDDVIGLIPCAVGGTSIADWLNNAPGTCYDQALQRTRLAMQQGTLAGILWHQGESDVANAATYAANATTLFARLRKDLGVGNVPVVVGTIGSFVPKSQAINAAIRSLPWKVPSCALAENWNLKSQGDNLHFDTASYKILGKRYADKWMGLAKLRKN